MLAQAIVAPVVEPFIVTVIAVVPVPAAEEGASGKPRAEADESAYGETCHTDGGELKWPAVHDAAFLQSRRLLKRAVV